MIAALAVVEVFAIAQHRLVLGIPFVDLHVQMLIIPAIVGCLFGFLLAKVRMLQTQQLQNQQTIVQQDHSLQLEIEQRRKFAEREQRLHFALEGANDGLWDWNIASGEVYYSPRWLSILGFRRDEIRPHMAVWNQLIHPSDRKLLDRSLNEHLAKQSNRFCVEVRMRSKRGEWIWGLIRGKAVSFSEHGQPVRVVGTLTDISQRKRIESALRSLAEGSANIANTDVLNTLVRCLAQSLDQRYGYLGQIIQQNGKRIVSGLAFWDDDRFKQAIDSHIKGSPFEVAEHVGYCFVPQNVQQAFPNDMLLHTLKAQSYIGIPLRADDDSILGVISVIDTQPLPDWVEPIAQAILPIFASRAAAELQRQNAERALFEEKERALVTLHSIGDAVVTTDAEGRVVYLNPVAQRLTGVDMARARGRPITEVVTIINEQTKGVRQSPIERCLLSGQSVSYDQLSLLAHPGGQELAIEESAAPIRDRNNTLVGAVMVFRDVSSTREMAKKMSWQATHDTLTGLVNRQEFEQRLDALIGASRHSKEQHMLLYIDLDQFKLVNDTSGHVAGDELLRQLAFLLQDHIRQADTLARLGGDEFGLLLTGCLLPQACEIANKMIHTINVFRFSWAGKTFEIGASIGVVAVDAQSESLMSVLSAADMACYAAKDLGRNRVQVYQVDDINLTRRAGEMQWVSRIKHALKDNRFLLYVQRIQDLRDSDEQRFEVMVRMLDEQRCLVMPNVFIPAAERYNLMPEVDRWIIEHLFEMIAGVANKSQCSYSINLSGKSFNDENFLSFVQDSIVRYQVNTEQICFEITETAAISNLPKAIEFIRELKKMGCRFALDDFGSGLSSFTYLKNLPVDYLKIDGSFVKDMVDDPIDRSMVSAINDIGHTMGIKTIAEFVENADILRLLNDIGVDYVQGYEIDKPKLLDITTVHQAVEQANTVH